MSFARDTISHGTTGVKTMTVGFQPVEAELIVRPAPGSTFTYIRKSDGDTDGTNQNCDSDSVFSGPQYFQRRYNDRMVSISEYSAGSWTEVFRVNVDSFTATEFKYNVVTANSNFQLLRKVRG